MQCNNPQGCDCANQRFCKWWGAAKKKPSKGLKKSRLKPESSKQKAVREEYSELRKIFLRKYPKCAICDEKAVDVHHKSGRGKNTNRVETWVSLCRPHHDMIHANPKWARDNGFLE